MDQLTKALKKEIRELVGLGYERSLAAELTNLETDFSAWRAGEIDPFELSERIHKFHNGAARELYNLYGERMLAEILVARLLADGTISESEVSAPLLEALSEEVKIIRGNLAQRR